MGAFFLFKKESLDETNLRDVRIVFQKKGFSEPRIFNLGEYELHLYKKQLVDYENFIEDRKGSIFSIGTLVYKGLGYRNSLEQLLEDYEKDAIEYDELIGSYCVIFYRKDQIHVLNDALNISEIFTDNHSFLTSSFLAASYSQKKLTIDRMASMEKLLTGYIVGENTLFNEIKRVIPSKEVQCGWNIHKWTEVQIPECHNKRDLSVERQEKKIREYMANIENLAREFKPELGLSGGYDSRMIFVGAKASWPFELDVHTHSTEGVEIHNIEKELVKEMAEGTGTTLSIVPTHNMDFYDSEGIKKILIDGYYFFDGRCAYNMGAFSPVYTRKYKIDTVGDHRLTLNGLGGEMYRNYYMNIKPIVNTKQWMKAKVFPDTIDYVVDKKVFNELYGYITGKMDQYLPFKWGRFLTNFKIRRYYSEMRMPDCDALNCNAHNQMEFYLTPFIERKMIIEAYKGRKFVGLSGQYQADIIRKLDKKIASYNSHYGYSFDQKEPVKHQLYMLIRGILPDSIWNIRINRMVGKNEKINRNKRYFETVREKCEFLDNAYSYLESIFPEIDFDYLVMDYAMMPNSSYIGVVYYMLRDRIAS